MSIYNINTASIDLLLASGSLVGSASYAQTASFALNGGGGGGSGAFASSSLSSSFASSSISSSYADTASVALNLPSDISVNSITASIISASYIETVDPTDPQQTATKAYVDNLTSQGLGYYFRTGSSDVADYSPMYNLDVPFTASEQYFTLTNAAPNVPGTVIISFISPVLGTTHLNAGTVQSHYRAWVTSGGLTMNRQYFIRSGSVERMIAQGVGVALTTTEAPYTSQALITSSVDTDPLNDRLVVKFIVVSSTSNPVFHFGVENNTSAGITVPVPSSNFVIKSGDTMTGVLTAPGFSGSLFGTASISHTASYAVTADTASLITALTSSNDVNHPIVFIFGSGSHYPRIDSLGRFYINTTSGSLTVPSLVVNQTSQSNDIIDAFGNVDGLAEITITNQFGTPLAASAFEAETSDGNDQQNFARFGIAGPAHNDPSFSIVQSYDAFLMNNGGNLLIGTLTPGQIIKFFTNGPDATSSLVYIDGTGIHGSGSIASASYLNPGATFYQVSGSNGVTASYIEPYDYSPIPDIYLPPYKVGRVFWDNRYNDWAWYAATGSGASSFRMHLGKEVSIGIHNPYPFTLPRLSVVYISGSSLVGQYQPDVYYAQADGTGLHAAAAGVVRNDIPSGSTGFMLVKGVMHRTNMGGFNVGDRLWLSTTTPGGMTITEPGQPNEQVQVGYCTEAGVLGSFLLDVKITPPPANAYAGIIAPIVVTDNQDGTITMSTGSVNLFPTPTGAGLITTYPLPQTTLSLVTGSTNYVIAQQSGSSLTAYYSIVTTKTSINNINVVPVTAIDVNYKGPGNWELHQFNLGAFALALANKEVTKDALLNGVQRQDGLTLFTTGSGTDFGITAGDVWYGVTLSQQGAYQATNTASCDTYHYVYSGSQWSFHTQSGYDNYYYNDATLGLQPLAPMSWSVNFIYRIVSDKTDAAMILSTQQYDNSVDAQAAQPPPNPPSTITDFGLLVGRFIVQSGSTSPIVQSAYTTQFAAASITNHNSLLGLQGGQGGEYYHLTAADYIGTGTGLVVRQTNPTMSNPLFQAATPFHIPYWSSNQTLTLTGSVQVQQSQYVTINSASLDPINPEALLVKQANTQSVNAIAAYGSVDNFFQINIQNQSASVNASSDLIATADNGDINSHYIDVGINSSVYSNPQFSAQAPNDGYVYVNSGSLVIGTQTSGSVIKFHTGGTTLDKVRVLINDFGFSASGSLYGNASTSTTASYVAAVETALYASRSTVTSTALYASASAVASWASSSIYASQSFYASSSVFASQSAVATTALYSSASAVASWASSSIYASSSLQSSQSVAATSALWASASAAAAYASSSFYASSSVFASSSATATSTLWASASAWSQWASASINSTSSIYASSSVIATSSLFASSSNFSVSSSFASSSNFALVASNSFHASSSITSTTDLYSSASACASWASSSIYASSSLQASQSVAANTSLFASASLSSSFASASNFALVASNSFAASQSIAANTSLYSSASAVASWASSSIYASSSLQASQSVAANSALFASASLSSSFASASNFSLVASNSFQASSSITATTSTYASASGVASWASSSIYASSSLQASQSVVAGAASWASSSIYASSSLQASQSAAATNALYASASAVSSWASSSIYASSSLQASQSVSAMGALFSSGSITSSFASSSLSSSFASSSYTASYAKGIPTQKIGIVSGSAFKGNPFTASISFTTAFTNNNYSIFITGEPNRTYTVASKSAASFLINTNSNIAPTGSVYWNAIVIGEYYT